MEFNDFSGLGIPEIMMNIMSCDDFSELTTSTVIFTCRSDFMIYYLSKVFIIVDKVYRVYINISDPVFRQINDFPLH